MTLSVWAWSVEFGQFSRQIPVGSKCLSLQDGWPDASMSWLVDVRAPSREMHFVTLGQIEETELALGHYVGGFKRGELAWHVFEVIQ